MEWLPTEDRLVRVMGDKYPRELAAANPSICAGRSLGPLQGRGKRHPYADRGEGAAVNGLALDDAEPDLDQVQPTEILDIAAEEDLVFVHWRGTARMKESIK